MTMGHVCVVNMQCWLAADSNAAKHIKHTQSFETSLMYRFTLCDKCTTNSNLLTSFSSLLFLHFWSYMSSTQKGIAEIEHINQDRIRTLPPGTQASAMTPQLFFACLFFQQTLPGRQCTIMHASSQCWQHIAHCYLTKVYASLAHHHECTSL